MTKSQAGLPAHLSFVTVRAPAKVNLILRVLDRRPDGYHNLWSVMQTVGLEDELRMRVTPHAGQILLICDVPALAVDKSNLVHSAASAVLDRAGQAVGLEIELRKRIPMGAGLGGGSSDAAATILGLNHLLSLRWSKQKMAEVGQPLGSDVPFFLFGPAALVSGRGETVTEIEIEGRRWAVLVDPGFGVETKWAYQELAAKRGALRPLSPMHVRINENKHLTWSQITGMAENDFEEPVFARYGVLREIRQTLGNLGAEFALLSGSGATVFGLFREESAARQAQVRMADTKPFTVHVVPTCTRPLGVQYS